MTYILPLILILNFCGMMVFAQDDPPSPLIYQAPSKNELTEVVADDKSFQIIFPGVPKSSKQDVEGITTTSYSVYRKGSNSIVNVGDFSFDLEQNKEKVYEIIKNSYLKLPKSKIESEKEVQLLGRSAREYEILEDYHYRKIRVLVVGKRVYEIKTDVTNWHIISDSTKKAFFDETERFFSSFKLL